MAYNTADGDRPPTEHTSDARAGAKPSTSTAPA